MKGQGLSIILITKIYEGNWNGIWEKVMED